MIKIKFLLPSTKPVGGIIKVFDYINHTKQLGYDYEIFYRSEPNLSSPIFKNTRYAEFKNNNIKLYSDLKENKNNYYFFSWPEDFSYIQNLLPNSSDYKKVIHIVQNVRHSNPCFCNGYALKLLSYPINRIILGDITYNSIKKFLSTYGLNEMIELGHDLDYFYPKDARLSLVKDKTIKVSYTTWKSNIGNEIANKLRNDNRFEFKSISKVASLSELRDLYHWSDVFLGTPNIQEGTYMPGLEALASGLSLIIPDVGGNMVYSSNNPQVLLVNFEDTSSYIEALNHYASNLSNDKITKTKLDKKYKDFDLSTEKLKFDNFLQKLSPKINIV